MTAPLTESGPIPTANGTLVGGIPAMTKRALDLRNQLIGRVDGIDLVRGLVMVIMLLDHTRDFTHASGVLFDPANIDRTNPALFFTRWITHLCAPTFVFLAGTSSGIQRIRGTSASDLAKFLFTRGLWLVFLELTLVRLVIWWNVSPSLAAMLQVIWVIGLGMMLLAAMVKLPMRVIGAIGVAIIVGHNLLDGIQTTPFRGPQAPMPDLASKLWMLFHQTGVFPLGDFPGPMVLALYPILPWLGVLLAGYGFAELYTWDRVHRRKAMFAIAITLGVVFLALRTGNFYGDPQPWSPQNTTAKTIMSFMNVQKYGPSLQFTCATLFWSIGLLAILEGRALTSAVSRVFVTFGRVPMFFYIGQWISAHLFGIAVAALYGRGFAYFFSNPMQNVPMTEFGGPLWLTWICWIAGAVLLYFPCRWYAGVKARRKDLVLLRYF